jgi:protein-L-isoaspartate(D-aspartate) O-methyltransferase
LADLAQLRQWFAQELRFTAPIRSPRVVAAFGAVPRENFLGLGPWTLLTKQSKVAVNRPDDLYHDVLVVLKAASGINNGRPSVWATQFDLLAMTEGETVLHAGAGSGYYSAILAECVGKTGRVIAVEIDADLARDATANLAPWTQVEVVCGNALDLPREPVDIIVASAGMSIVPMRWLRSLKENGRLLLPLTIPGQQREEHMRRRRGGPGSMLHIERAEMKFRARFGRGVTFIECAGTRDQAAAQALSVALRRGDLAKVRSLQLDREPDETCWLKGDGWWLSTAAP